MLCCNNNNNYLIFYINTFFRWKNVSKSAKFCLSDGKKDEKIQLAVKQLFTEMAERYMNDESRNIKTYGDKPPKE